jgi:subtilisin family serine protease
MQMAWVGRFRSAIACGALAAAGLSAGIAQAGAEPAATKLRPALAQDFDAARTADFWIRFEDRADLSAAAAVDDWVERGAGVAAALRATARASQERVRALLDAEGASYEPFWATNAIYVHDGTEELAAAVAARPEVASLHAPTAYAPPDPEEGSQVRTAAAVEWGIANVRADQVWEQYGVRGAGITVANIDTGVQFSHPALVEQYRGNLGGGAFDHDYNWFDAAARCGGAPCDGNGHGTHTMGTMAGDGGEGNRIGMAPDVTWIAANGCCPSDAALVASGQWMLEPTDVEGGNPDASKRPHVINNSWGSEIPSNDPFMEDVVRGWEASGIFGAWSNGNIGPACRTSSAPGSRIASYSTGAYDVTNTIADFSSRGAGQDGDVKPNISAPGVDVRSSVPGGGYQSASGTSMAAPHVAGAVALLWSAAPALIGDVAGTRARLDASAIDAPDDRCGGTAADNSVYGEGRLDALALLDAAPIRNTGTLTATVTDASTRRPIAGAEIAISGLSGRERVTGRDGTYSLALPAGDYRVTASAWGYPERTVDVSVETGDTSTARFALRALPTVTVRGRVRDGSGHGWPLYATVDVTDMPDGRLHTRPEDGRYSVELPANATYSLAVASMYGGYEAVTEELTVRERDVTRDIDVPVEADRCEAAGYAHAFDGLQAGFDAGAPAGWTVVDHALTGNVWRFDDPFERGNLTGGTGGFAIAQSPGGPGGELDSSLISPVVDLAGHEQPILRFRQDFVRLLDIARVDLSLDGGGTWDTLVEQLANVRGPREEIVPIPQAAGARAVRVRFHMSESAFNSRAWEIDDVFVGTRTCEPLRGGLVLGHVRDRNTGAPLAGAVVTSERGETARSEATPDDPQLDDGFYWMFSSATGRHSFTATIDGYGADRESADVDASEVEEKDFRPYAGRLRVEPDDVTESVRSGRNEQRTVTITNTGSRSARLELRERDRTGAAAGPGGELAAHGPPVVRVPGEFSPLGFGAGAAAGGGSWRHWPASGAWLDLAGYPTRIMDNTVGEHRGRVYSVGGVDGVEIVARGYVYDPAQETWTRIADLPEPREAAAGAFIGDRFYVSGGWDGGTRTTTTTFVYDPATDAWTRVADAPVHAAGAGRAVLDGKLYLVGGCTNACGLSEVRRYDPATDSWENLAEYPVITAHLACAGIAGKLYCTGGIRRGGQIFSSTYAYDPATNAWTPRADMPIAAWGMGYTGSSDRLIVSGGTTPQGITNESFAYDPETDRWTRLPASRYVLYRGGSTCGLHRIGGSMATGFVPTDFAELLPTYGDCVPADLPWLSLGRRHFTVAAGERVRVTVTLDADGAEPGEHRGGLWIKEDTPYLVHPVDVTMEVRRR